MHLRVPGAAAPLAAALALAAPAEALQIDHAKTEAEAREEFRDDTTSAVVLQLGFRADLTAVPPEPIVPPEPVEVPPEPVKVSWEAVGGVSPTPFLVTIPVACFERVTELQFSVEGTICGVTVQFDPDGRGLMDLTVRSFEARLALRGDREGTGRFDMEAAITDEALVRGILGGLGGAGVSLSLNDVSGRVTAVSIPNEVETLSGIDPQPF